MTPIALTIAGSDPSGGAGIQADLKTFHQRNVYGMSVLTLLTVQNTCSVDAVEPLAPGFILAQLDSVLADLPPHAAKTGALGTCDVSRGRRGVAEIEDTHLQAKARSQRFHFACRSPGQHRIQAPANGFARDQLARVPVCAIDHPRLENGVSPS